MMDAQKKAHRKEFTSTTKSRSKKDDKIGPSQVPKKKSNFDADNQEYKAKQKRRTSNSQYQLDLIARYVMSMPLKSNKPKNTNDTDRTKNKKTEDFPTPPLNIINLIAHYVNKLNDKHTKTKYGDTNVKNTEISQEMPKATEISKVVNISKETHKLNSVIKCNEQNNNNTKTNEYNILYPSNRQIPKRQPQSDIVEKQIKTQSQIETLYALGTTIEPLAIETQIGKSVLKKQGSTFQINRENDETMHTMTPKMRNDSELVHYSYDTVVSSIQLNHDNSLSMNLKPLNLSIANIFNQNEGKIYHPKPSSGWSLNSIYQPGHKVHSAETYVDKQSLHPSRSRKISSNEKKKIDPFVGHPLEVSTLKYLAPTPSCISSSSAAGVPLEQFPHSSRRSSTNNAPMESYVDHSHELLIPLKKRRLSSFFAELHKYYNNSNSTEHDNSQDNLNKAQFLPSNLATIFETPIPLAYSSALGLTYNLALPSSMHTTTTSTKFTKTAKKFPCFVLSTNETDRTPAPHKACNLPGIETTCTKSQKTANNTPLPSEALTFENPYLSRVQSLPELTTVITPSCSSSNVAIIEKSSTLAASIDLTNDEPNLTSTTQISLHLSSNRSASNELQNNIFKAPTPPGLVEPYHPGTKYPCELSTLPKSPNFFGEINTTITNSVKVPVPFKQDITSSSRVSISTNACLMPLNASSYNLDKNITITPMSSVPVNEPSVLSRNSSTSINSLQRHESSRTDNIDTDTDTQDLLDEIDKILN